jgi:shikimate kinase
MTNEANKRNVVLCGFMATGKSSVGRQLAELLEYEFLDMDAIIEAETGMSIPQIFSSQGEPAFRALECRVVEQVAQRSGCVIATGGGTIVNPKNLESLKRSGIVIALTADPQTILLRTGSGKSRPMLGEGDRMRRILALMEQRSAAYAMADMTVDTSAHSIQKVAEIIINRLQESGFCPTPKTKQS